MKEFKFRVWDKISKKMYYDGNLENGSVVVMNIEGGLQFSDKSSYKETDFEKMQYTGLKDKNGNEIYEGDILDFDEEECGGKFNPEIIKIEKIIGKWDLCGVLEDLKSFRSVIGNIYENPELIKESIE